MNTFVRRVSAVLSLALVVAALSVGTGTSTATAARAKLGRVLHLALTSSATSSGGHRLSATWDPVSGASAYIVKLTVGGTTVSSGRFAETSYADTVVAPAGTQATVEVTPADGKRRGRRATASTTLPDITRPTGAFKVEVTELTATVTQTALSDDASTPEQITRSIDWDDGAGFQAYPAGEVATHTYAEFGRYVPRVRLVDAADNTTLLPLPAVLLGDIVAPSGAFTAAPQTAWTGFTKVALTQVSVDDDYTPDNLVTRSIDWGDGTAVEAWGVDKPTHVYTSAGNYPARVTLGDEAGNERVVEVSMPVTVMDDTVAPALRLSLPKHQLRRLSTWKWVRGTARDRETGVDHVRVRMVQKRAKGWVALKNRRWVRASSSKAAWAKATPRTRQVAETGKWRVRVPNRRRGMLVYRSWATDVAGNVGAVVVHRQRLTKR